MTVKHWQAFLVLAGIVAILIMRFAPPGALLAAFVPPPGIPGSVDDLDVWVTPYYLRYNTNQATDSRAILPRGSGLTFGLGVPQLPSGGAPVNLGTAI